MSIGAGVAALTNWRNAFFYYLIFIVVVIMQAILLPAFAPEKKDKEIEQSVQAAGKRPKFGYAVYLTVGAMLVFMSIAMVILYNLAIFVMNENLGTSAETGLSSSFNTVASFIFCVSFGYIFKYFKRYVSLLGLVFMACAYFGMSIAHSMITVYIASLFLGASMGCIFPYLMTQVALVAPKASKTMAVTLLYGYLCGPMVFGLCCGLDRTIGRRHDAAALYCCRRDLCRFCHIYSDLHSLNAKE